MLPCGQMVPGWRRAAENGFLMILRLLPVLLPLPAKQSRLRGRCATRSRCFGYGQLVFLPR